VTEHDDMVCLAASVCVTGDRVDVHTSVQDMARSLDAVASFLAARAWLCEPRLY